MPANLGYLFSPNRERLPDDPRSRGVSGASPQEAVRILSVRNPERVPRQGALAPGLLLNSPGGAGAPPGLMAVLQALISLSQGQVAPGMPMGPTGGPTPPRVRPGDAPIQGFSGASGGGLAPPPLQVSAPPAPAPQGPPTGSPTMYVPKLQELLGTR